MPSWFEVRSLPLLLNKSGTEPSADEKLTKIHAAFLPRNICMLKYSPQDQRLKKENVFSPQKLERNARGVLRPHS